MSHPQNGVGRLPDSGGSPLMLTAVRYSEPIASANSDQFRSYRAVIEGGLYIVWGRLILGVGSSCLGGNDDGPEAAYALFVSRPRCAHLCAFECSCSLCNR